MFQKKKSLNGAQFPSFYREEVSHFVLNAFYPHFVKKMI